MCAWVENLFYKNGYLPNGHRQIPATGDTQGGGNADGFTVAKTIVNNTNTVNYGPNNLLVRNIAYHNCDDSFDLSFIHSLVEDNLAIAAGPTGNQGFKIFTWTDDLVIRGNLAWSNNGRGVDMRELIGTRMTVYNNTIVHNQQQGLHNVGVPDLIKNNVCELNSLTDFDVIGPQPPGVNWARDGHNVPPQYSGDPGLTNDTLGSPTLNLDPPITVTDGVTTSGSRTVTSATADFTGRIGQAVDCAGSIPSGNPDTLIVSVVDAHTAVLSRAASASGTGLTFTIGYYGGPGWNYFLDLGWPYGSTVAAKRTYLLTQVKGAFTPTVGSALINLGTLISGYHCPTADDDPIHPASPNDPRVHWWGLAPTIGAFQYNPLPGHKE
jgi:hypothetical protein